MQNFRFPLAVATGLCPTGWKVQADMPGLPASSGGQFIFVSACPEREAFLAGYWLANHHHRPKNFYGGLGVAHSILTGETKPKLLVGAKILLPRTVLLTPSQKLCFPGLHWTQGEWRLHFVWQNDSLATYVVPFV